MAQRRMFSLDIVNEDKFMELSSTAQALYFHLGMRADDEGLIGSCKQIVRGIGFKMADVEELEQAGYVIIFDSGVVVIKDWCIHNAIRKDRMKPTRYVQERSLLTICSDVYELKETNNNPVVQPMVSMETEQVRAIDGAEGGQLRATDNQEDEQSRTNDNQMTTKCGEMSAQVRLGEVRLGEVSIKPPFIPPEPEWRLQFSDAMADELEKWLAYKREKKQHYKPTGLQAFMSRVKKQVGEYGETAVIELVEECMANNWQGIIWDKLAGSSTGTKNKSCSAGGAGTKASAQEQSNPFLNLLQQMGVEEIDDEASDADYGGVTGGLSDVL